MNSRTYRAVAPIDPAASSNTISSIGRALLIVAALLVTVVIIRWLGEKRIENRVAVWPAPVVESVPSQQTINSAIGQPVVSRFEYEHQRCENLGYTDVVFEDRPYGWFVTCTE